MPPPANPGFNPQGPGGNPNAPSIPGPPTKRAKQEDGSGRRPSGTLQQQREGPGVNPNNLPAPSGAGQQARQAELVFPRPQQQAGAPGPGVQPPGARIPFVQFGDFTASQLPQPPKFDPINNVQHRVQRDTNFKFALYRTSGKPPSEEYDLAEKAWHGRTKLAFYEWSVPMPGTWPGIWRPPGVYPYAKPYALWWHYQKRMHGQQGSPPNPEADDAMEQRIIPKLVARDLHLVKGGNGIAALFESGARTPGDKQQFVVKCLIHDEPGYVQRMEAEKDMTWTFRGAMHCVQMLHPPQIIAASPPYSPEKTDVRSIMFLEYYKRGSLQKALTNMYFAQQSVNLNQKSNLGFETRQLYHIFLCLVKSLIAMCYPPKHNQELYQGQRRPCREICPPKGTKRKRNLIHFDIDPQNILVGDSNPETGHGMMPCLHLSDFGLSVDYASAARSSVWTHDSRRYAKHPYYTPEQFTEEWDFFWPGHAPDNPWGSGKRPKIAGQYSWRSNLFQMGLTMLVLITQSDPPSPPYPARAWVPRMGPNDADDDDEDPNAPPRNPAGDAFFIDPSRNGPKDVDAELYDDPREANNPFFCRVWSYGAFILNDSPLLEYHKIHRPLRTLVAWCLADDPYYRPRLRVLENYLLDQMRGLGIVDERKGRETAKRPGNEEDEVLEKWINLVFDTPSSYWNI
ncbi:hypothetical protein VTJ49DRAFT_3859 [Mycothermus thermophilus]|uniref:Protein kinase domain-containing protein n=1 Tax=Humicola insolens TaxID=85995 RepID=A0ABR3VRL2_HUMIN